MDRPVKLRFVLVECQWCLQESDLSTYTEHLPCKSNQTKPALLDDVVAEFKVHVKCSRCKTKFVWLCDFVEHFRNCYLKYDEKARIERGKQLRELYIKPSSIRLNSISELMEMREMQKTHNSQTNNRFCIWCGNRFRSETLAQQHAEFCAKTVAQIQGRRCQSCRVTFTRPESLQKHLLRAHNVRKLRCDLCAQWFVSYTELKDHFVEFGDAVGCRMKKVGTKEDLRRITEKLVAKKILVRDPVTKFVSLSCAKKENLQ